MAALGLILCVDIGTSSLKGACIDFDGQVRAFVREPYREGVFQGGEIHTAGWEAAFIRAVGGLAGGKTPFRPEAVCISGNGPTLVPVAYTGQALPPLHWHDSRVRLVESGGRSFFLPKAAWFMAHCPAAYAKTRYFFSSQEWLSFRLGAEPVTALPSAAYEPYYWDRDQCARFGVDFERFPPMTLLGSSIGKVSVEGERRFGLARGIPIIAGGPDFIMALIGTGALAPGMACDRAGSSEGINVCVAKAPSAPGSRILPHPVEGLWNLGAVLPSSGRLFDWYRHLTNQEDRSYADLLGEIIPPGEKFPSLQAEAGTWERFSSLFVEGESTIFHFPQELPSKAALGRTVLEAMGFMVRDALEGLAAHGFSIGEMRLSGGQAKSPLWNSLKADITGVRLLLPEIIDGELAGNACTAAVALGEAAGIMEAAGRMIRVARVYEPDAAMEARYGERYSAYRAFQARLRDLRRENL